MRERKAEKSLVHSLLSIQIDPSFHGEWKVWGPFLPRVIHFLLWTVSGNSGLQGHDS